MKPVSLIAAIACLALGPLPARRAAGEAPAPPGQKVNRATARTVPDGGVVLLADSARERPQKRYFIALKLVELREEANVDALAIRVHPFQDMKKPHKALPRGKYHTFTKMNCAACHSVKGKSGWNRLLWDTIINDRGALQTWVGKVEGVKVLAEPQLTVAQDRVARFVAGGERKLQYLRRIKKGTYQLEEETAQIGITSKLKVQDAGNGKVRLNPLVVSVSAVVGREKLEGVALPVGKPIIKKISVDTSLVTRLGKSSVISVDSPRGGRVLISVKVGLLKPANPLTKP